MLLVTKKIENFLFVVTN